MLCPSFHPPGSPNTATAFLQSLWVPVGLSPSCAHVSPTGFSAPVNTTHVGAPVTAAAPASTSSHGGQQPQTVPTNASVSAPPHARTVLTRAQMYSDPHSVLLYSHHILNTHVRTRLHTCAHTVHTAFIHVHTCLYMLRRVLLAHSGNMAHSIT